jgi:Mn2+/Fe2+ NRAMP family transporter
VIAASTLIGALIGFTALDPIRMLFWAAVINGFVAVPVMIAMMIMAGSVPLMGLYRSGLLLSVSGWGSTLLMAAAALILVASLLF